jgi:hypothetical protein
MSTTQQLYGMSGSAYSDEHHHHHHSTGTCIMTHHNIKQHPFLKFPEMADREGYASEMILEVRKLSAAAIPFSVSNPGEWQGQEVIGSRSLSSCVSFILFCFVSIFSISTFVVSCRMLKYAVLLLFSPLK